MALNGTLAIVVHRLEVQLPPATEDSPQKPQEHNVKFVIGGQEKHTKFNKSQTDADIEQTINFDLKDLSGEEDVLMEIHTHNKKKTALVANKLPLSSFIGELKSVVITFTSAGPKPTTVKVFVSSKWTSKTSTQKYAGEGAATAVDVAKAAITGHPQTALSLSQDTHRPWFTRVSYYYDTTKHVYEYTTSFRVVSKFARFGESSANLVLQKVSGKSLHDLDQQFLVPVLDTLDNKVDETISTVVTKLFEGQQYVLKKKDDVVDTASSVASKGSSSVSSVVGKTVGGVVKVKDYTTTQLVNVSSAAYGTVVGVKDYTTTQVVNVSSSTYGTVKGATVYVLSHVPYLGAKIRA
jgi:hypothetical protein